MTVWWLAPSMLIIIAFAFRYFMKGYSYIAHLLSLIAVLTVVRNFLSPALFRIIIVLLISGTVLFTLFEIPVIANAHTDRDCGKKYLIVLGAEVVGSKPSRSLRYRLDAAKHYLERFPESIAIVRGGQGEHEEITEASCMYDQLISAGIP